MSDFRNDQTNESSEAINDQESYNDINDNEIYKCIKNLKDIRHKFVFSLASYFDIVRKNLIFQIYKT